MMLTKLLDGSGNQKHTELNSPLRFIIRVKGPGAPQGFIATATTESRLLRSTGLSVSSQFISGHREARAGGRVRKATRCPELGVACTSTSLPTTTFQLPSQQDAFGGKRASSGVNGHSTSIPRLFQVSGGLCKRWW